MKRRLFTIVSVLSLVLCIGSTAMWVRSYWFIDWLYYTVEHGTVRPDIHATSCGVLPHRGEIEIDWIRDSLFPTSVHERGPWNCNHIDIRDDDRYFEAQFDMIDSDEQVRIREPIRSWMGIGYGSDVGPPMSVGPPEAPRNVHFLTVPYWLVTVTFSLLPALLILRTIHRNKRTQSGHCVTCGYDLQATPDRCPECGSVPEKKDAVSS